jgi:hypothetical protein
VPADACSCHHPLGKPAPPLAKPAPPLAKPTLGLSANASAAAITAGVLSFENIWIISILKRKSTVFSRNDIGPTL